MKFNDQRLFGVEIEFNTVDSVYAIINEAREQNVIIYQEGYNHQLRHNWKIVSDGSCGLELVSPPLHGEEGFRQLKVVCDLLNKYNVKIDKRCGLHVHHDAHDFTIQNFQNIFAIYTRYRKAFDSMMPESRRGNNNFYCKDLSFSRNYSSEASEVDQMFKEKEISFLASKWNSGSRYAKVNIQSYYRHGTVEFRQHSGTANYEKIMNWIILTQLVVNKSFDIKRFSTAYKPSQDKWDCLKDFLGLMKSRGADELLVKVCKYFTKRINDLAKEERRVA